METEYLWCDSQELKARWFLSTTHSYPTFSISISIISSIDAVHPSGIFLTIFRIKLFNNFSCLTSPTNLGHIICIIFMKYNGKGKAVPLQAWSGPEGSRKLRFPNFMTATQDDGKVVSLTNRPPLPQEMVLELVSVWGCVDPRALVRSEGFYINEKFQWHHLGSSQRPSDL